MSKVGKCHCDNVVSSEPTKTNKTKARISHFKSTSGQQFCSRISGLHTFGRKQRLPRFPTMHYSGYDLTYPRLNSESSQTSLCLAVILMYSIQFLGWFVLIDYFDARYTTVFDQFDNSWIGLMHHHLWSKSGCSMRLASSTRPFR